MTCRMKSKVALSGLVLAGLAGCGGGGGGGGGGGNNPPANSPPVMPAASFAGTEEQDATGQVVATDANNDPLTFAVVTAPTRGALVSFSASGLGALGVRIAGFHISVACASL